MSAFAIPLLEGTDPILTGAYKKREDPVNDCATISQHRGYSGKDLTHFFRACKIDGIFVCFICLLT